MNPLKQISIILVNEDGEAILKTVDWGKDVDSIT